MSRNGSPGPAAYNTNSGKSDMPSFSMGKKCVVRSRSVSPGPSAYRVLAARDAPRWGFGSSRRVEFSEDSGIPGPGEYEIQSLCGKGPSFSIQSRTRVVGESHASDFPGPTSYGGLYTQFD